RSPDPHRNPGTGTGGPGGSRCLPAGWQYEGGAPALIRFLSLLLAGLSLGTVYALVAMGFVIIYKASEVLNFAHGSLLLLGAFVVARLHEAIGFPAAVAVAFA